MVSDIQAYSKLASQTIDSAPKTSDEMGGRVYPYLIVHKYQRDECA